MKKMKIMLMSVIGVLLFLGPAYGADYVSLYHYERLQSFCSASTDAGGAFEAGAYPCQSAEYPYKYTRSLQGFMDIYDLNDPRILCKKDYGNYAQCGLTEAYLSFTLTSLDRGTGRDVSAFPDGFRIFIPPGTTYAAVTLFMPIDAQEGVILRYKQAPDGVYLSYANDPDHYLDVPWESTNIKLNTLRDRDMYVRNSGGHAYALPTMGASPYLSVGDSGWLYIRKLPFTSDRIHDVKVTLKVDLAAYLAWYNSVRPSGTGGCVDSNQATSGSTLCWDVGGDPWAEGAYVQTVTSCSSSNLDGCIDGGGCEGAGGYWYGNTCNAAPVCTDTTLGSCQSEDTCEGSGFYWYDNQCNAGPQCDANDVTQCTSQNTCEDSGFFWYNNECNVTPPCSASHLEVCSTPTDCEAMGGTWDGSQCVSSCGPDNLSACEGSLCAYYGGYWNGSTCTQSTGGTGGGTYTPPPASPPSTSGSNPFSAFLSMLNPGQSTSGSPDTCDASHLNLCESETECKSAGGYIAGDGACKAVETAPASQEAPANLSPQMESAPIALVDGAASDGVITPGEKMHLQFNFPGYGSPVDAYAAIQFPGAGNQLLYFQDDDGGPLLEQFKAFATSFSGPLNKTVYEDFNACAAFGSSYNGNWSVYFLIIPAQNQTFQTAGDLWNYIMANNVDYRLQYYRFNVQCGGLQ